MISRIVSSSLEMVKFTGHRLYSRDPIHTMRKTFVFVSNGVKLDKMNIRYTWFTRLAEIYLFIARDTFLSSRPTVCFIIATFTFAFDIWERANELNTTC